jgi:hypothetical protein
MRISVLTLNQTEYGIQLLNLLQWRGISVEQVVVLNGRWETRWKWLQRSARRVGWPDTLLYTAWTYAAQLRARRGFWRGHRLERDYRRLAKRVDYTSYARSESTLEALRSAQPELCLLGQSGIVPPSLLAIPSMATLNAHPGILPDYRGIDTEKWAIHEGRFDKVGCTLHVVDAGVDTGPILGTRPYAWVGDETLTRLEQRLYETCVDLLVESCLQPWPAFRDQAVPQGWGKQYYLMPLRLWPGVARKLQAYLLQSREH